MKYKERITLVMPIITRMPSMDGVSALHPKRRRRRVRVNCPDADMEQFAAHRRARAAVR